MWEIIFWSYFAVAFSFGVWHIFTVPIPDEVSFHGVPWAATGWFIYVGVLAAFWPITGAVYAARAIDRRDSSASENEGK